MTGIEVLALSKAWPVQKVTRSHSVNYQASPRRPKSRLDPLTKRWKRDHKVAHCGIGPVPSGRRADGAVGRVERREERRRRGTVALVEGQRNQRWPSDDVNVPPLRGSFLFWDGYPALSQQNQNRVALGYPVVAPPALDPRGLRPFSFRALRV